jgi:hypothetical protein
VHKKTNLMINDKYEGNTGRDDWTCDYYFGLIEGVMASFWELGRDKAEGKT